MNWIKKRKNSDWSLARNELSQNYTVIEWFTLLKKANNQDSLDFIEDKSKQKKIIENQKVETSDTKCLRNKPWADCNEERLIDKIIAENEASGSWGISIILAKKFVGDYKDLLQKDLALDGDFWTKRNDL